MEKSEHEKLDQLFKKLEQGEMPNFLEVMAAISDVSDIYPEPEQCPDPTLCLTCG